MFQYRNWKFEPGPYNRDTRLHKQAAFRFLGQAYGNALKMQVVETSNEGIFTRLLLLHVFVQKMDFFCLRNTWNLDCLACWFCFLNLCSFSKITIWKFLFFTWFFAFHYFRDLIRTSTNPWSIPRTSFSIPNMPAAFCIPLLQRSFPLFLPL